MSAEGDKMVKAAWTAEEDALLREQIQKLGGPGNWTAIAEALEGRSSKSCRLRWCNQLNPTVKRGPFTEEEDQKILAAHAIHGNKWAVISRCIPGRTDNQVKNRFNSTLRRVLASQRREAQQAKRKRKVGDKREREEGAESALFTASKKCADATRPRTKAAETSEKSDGGAESDSDEQIGLGPGLETLIQASLIELKRMKGRDEQQAEATDTEETAVHAPLSPQSLQWHRPAAAFRAGQLADLKPEGISSPDAQKITNFLTPKENLPVTDASALARPTPQKTLPSHVVPTPIVYEWRNPLGQVSVIRMFPGTLSQAITTAKVAAPAMGHLGALGELKREVPNAFRSVVTPAPVTPVPVTPAPVALSQTLQEASTQWYTRMLSNLGQQAPRLTVVHSGSNAGMSDCATAPSSTLDCMSYESKESSLEHTSVDSLKASA